MLTRRQSLLLGALAVTSLTIRDAAADLGATKGRRMNKLFVYAPHPDDEMLSMGLAILHYIASGYEVHLVSMNSGGALGVANTLNGTTHCSLGTEHPYTHDPDREGYVDFTVPDVSAARILEARSSLGAMAMFPPINPAAPGAVVHHAAGLPDGFGGPPDGPVSAAGVAMAKDVIKSFIDANPNSTHFTMSDSEATLLPDKGHPDHGACGQALRELKLDPVYGPPLANAKFFVSRLYWAPPGGSYPPEVLAAAAGSLQWFGSGSNSYLAHKAAYDSWLRGQVYPVWKAWNPAGGSFAVGYHQVPGQFINNFAAGVSMGNLTHL